MDKVTPQSSHADAFLPVAADTGGSTSLVDGLTGELLPLEYSETVRGLLAIAGIYAAAVREIVTRLENLNEDFRVSLEHRPIHQIQTRIKSPKSIIDKLARKQFPVSVLSARENIEDIAGVRVICAYIDDIYRMAQLITGQGDIQLLIRRDYIRNPKTSGYRSLHLIVTVPVFLCTGIERVMVEIQIRTIAMDFWASLEHDLAYKLPAGRCEAMANELRDCADVIARTDERMQDMHRLILAVRDVSGTAGKTCAPDMIRAFETDYLANADADADAGAEADAHADVDAGAETDAHADADIG